MGVMLSLKTPCHHDYSSPASAPEFRIFLGKSSAFQPIPYIIMPMRSNKGLRNFARIIDNSSMKSTSLLIK